MTGFLEEVDEQRWEKQLANALLRAATAPLTAADVRALFARFFALETRDRKRSSLYHPLPGPSDVLIKLAGEQTLRDVCTALEDYVAQANDSESTLLAIGLLGRLNTVLPAAPQDIAAVLHKIEVAQLSAPALLEILMLLHERQNWQPLRDLARKAIEQVPATVDYYPVALDLFMLAEGRLLIRSWRQGEQDPALIEKTCTSLDWATERAAEHPKSRYLLKSVKASIRGDYTESIKYMLKAQSAPGLMFRIFSHNLDHFVPLSWNPPLLDTAGGPGTTYYRHSPNDRACLLVSSDRVYFEKYADHFLASFAHWNQDNLIHWHFVNYKPLQHIVDALEARHGVRINYTVEQQPLLDTAPELIRGYYACARYIHLPAYLAHYGKIFITDVDGVICQPIDAQLLGSENTVYLHGGLLHKPHPFPAFIWDSIRAGAFGITGDNQSVQFAKYVASYLRRRFEECRGNNQRFFYADQVALMLAFCRFKDTLSFRSIDGVYSQITDGFREPIADTYLFPHQPAG